MKDVILNGKHYRVEPINAERANKFTAQITRFNRAVERGFQSEAAKMKAFERVVLAMIECVCPSMAKDWKGIYRNATDAEREQMLHTARLQLLGS